MSMMCGAAGAVVTVKVPDDVTEPPGAVTAIVLVAAPVGTVASICASSVTENVVAAIPSNLTAVAPEKLVPVDRHDRADRAAGRTEAGDRGRRRVASNVKDVGEKPVVAPTVTPIKPLVAPDGTVALMRPLSLTVNVVAAVEPNFTADAPVNRCPRWR